jgi:hypothetical protein
VFVHTNHKQWVGALVAEYALKRNSAHPDRFDTRIINIADYPFFKTHQDQNYLRGRLMWNWDNEDLQSFTLTRFMPPELMGYQGRALVIDPDVFAVGDVWDLLSRDMQGKAIMCRRRSGTKGAEGCQATSVMLLDCEKLSHWQVERDFQEMFDGRRDYMDWICLRLENPDSIGSFEEEWNDFNHLGPETKMLHTTKRKTQPWKTGLPIDFRPQERFRWFPPRDWLSRARRQIFGEYAFLGRYKPNPDPNQEAFFFGLVKECMEKGIISEELLRNEMRQNHVRHDAFEVLERTPPLPV